MVKIGWIVHGAESTPRTFLQPTDKHDMSGSNIPCLCLRNWSVGKVLGQAEDHLKIN